MRSLYTKLTLVLLALFCIIGGVFLLGAGYSAHMYQQEVAQRLNRDLAGYIASEHKLLSDGAIVQPNMERLFHTLMIINPSLELYLLDPGGKILGFSAAPEKVITNQVRLGPLKQLISDQQQLPILGDDPRNPGARKAFSTATIGDPNQPDGYIYAVLGGAKLDRLTHMLQKSYILRWSTLAIGAALLFSLLSGMYIFSLLTRRLRILERTMTQFRLDNFSKIPEYTDEYKNNADEIDRIGNTFTEMADRIQSQMSRLKETDALRRELVANVSHDLRTPLASLRGYLETLAIKNSHISAQERSAYLETAMRHADRLNKLIEELFELAKLDAHELEPQREVFSIAELVHDVIQKFQLRAEQCNATIEVDVDPATPMAEADIGMIERVLDNLIDNALQHIDKNGVIKLSLSLYSKQIRIKVSDNGHGIAGHDLPHIFERFYRKVSGNSSGGAGLGLAIAQRIVELHGSQLSVKSTVNQGSVFEFALPVQGT